MSAISLRRSLTDAAGFWLFFPAGAMESVELDFAICARIAPSTFSIPDQSDTTYQIQWVPMPGTRSMEAWTPQANTTPSAMSFVAHGLPHRFDQVYKIIFFAWIDGVHVPEGERLRLRLLRGTRNARQ